MAPNMLYLGRRGARAMAAQHTVEMARRLKRASTGNGAPIWARMAEMALKPSSARRTVNVNRIARHTKASDVVAVPGKVLGTGGIGHAVTLGAFSVSRAAAAKVREAGGSVVTIERLAEMHPAGTGVRILG